MSSSPKRQHDEGLEGEDEASKRPRLTKAETNGNDEAIEAATAAPSAAPDSQIDHAAAIAYWSSTEPTVNGVLGGYPQVSRVDLQGSSNFLAKLRRASKHHPSSKKLQRAVDCGAGIGRIAKGFLVKVAEKVDVVEPVKQFTDQVKAGPSIGDIYNVGLEEWDPQAAGLGPYDLVWNQWCVGQLTDVQFVEYLRRLPAVLSEGGWIVVKENLSTVDEDIFDDTDSSVTRTDDKFRKLFDQADLRVVGTELQKGMPEGLYPVRTYALQPKT